MYTDFFLQQVIDRLKHKNAVLPYQADHGEALGENGVWFHANDQLPCHRPAGFIWMSDSYKAHHPDYFYALCANKDKRWRTDYVFHTMLDLAQIESPLLVAGMSVVRANVSSASN